MARIAQINGAFGHGIRISALFQVKQHHPREGRKELAKKGKYQAKIQSFCATYKDSRLFTCAQKRRRGSGVGIDFRAVYAFNQKVNEDDEEEEKGLAGLGQKYYTMAKKLDLSRMVAQ